MINVSIYSTIELLFVNFNRITNSWKKFRSLLFQKMKKGQFLVLGKFSAIAQ